MFRVEMTLFKMPPDNLRAHLEWKQRDNIYISVFVLICFSLPPMWKTVFIFKEGGQIQLRKFGWALTLFLGNSRN